MPDFASQEYWDNRFRKDSKPFDWLVPGKVIRDIAAEVIEKTNLEQPEILHIGCGTADSHSLRSLVKHPRHVLNVDYSEPAIQAGSKREQELLTSAQIESLLVPGKHDSVQDTELPPAMRWSCKDLLSLHSALSLLHTQQDDGKLFDLVLDKSTSDSISCGPNVPLSLPYPLSINGWSRRVLGSGTTQLRDVHPLHVLALHLAALTRPGTGRWIVISYSEERFPFLPPFPATVANGMLSDDVIQAGFTHPHQLWRLEAKEQINLDEGNETLAERKKRLSMGYVHQPRVSHWLYILRRTDALVVD
ncbi:putative S-adenosyl-L-methionine-dependent methyltransferase [Septoria linicola]|nr:putative S-adenosyl-L-methionine-dependent methyltransferase [Septoria linicola]